MRRCGTRPLSQTAQTRHDLPSPSVLGWGLTQNDAHRGNLLLAGTAPDTYVLADYVLADGDGVFLGPREIDLVQEGVPGGELTLPEPQRLAFSRRYGFDLADRPGHPVLREARQLHSLAASTSASPPTSLPPPSSTTPGSPT